MLAIVAATVLAASTPAVPVAHTTTASRAAQTARRHNRPPRRGCRTEACRERVARRQCSNRRPRACILRAAIHRRQDYGAMVRVAWCESTMNPAASNGAHAGLFQFRVAAPSTWATTPYAHRSPYSAKWSALAAAWMWQRGRRGEWACRG